MKKILCSVVMVAFVFIFVASVSAVENATDDSQVASSTEEAVPELPGSVDMTLGVKPNPKVMPANFRGGDPDSGLVHALEDVHYEKQEHSIIYAGDAGAVAEGAEFAGDPNITWDTKVKDADGNFQTVSSLNTNIATDGGKFFTPGEYQIGNGGARQVNPPASASPTPKEDGEEEEEEDGEDGEDIPAAPETVTAQQTMGVFVHDVTSPNLWIAFQEGAGNVDMAKDKKALEEKIEAKIVQNFGRPHSLREEDYLEVNYIFIDEGEPKERDADPWSKTARVTVAGALFNAKGVLKVETGIAKSVIKNNSDMTQHVKIEAKTALSSTGKEFLGGVFVRRNVPFIFASKYSDNRAPLLADAASRIEDADGNVIEKSDDASYMFRVPNYPREDYKEQPEYFFVSEAEDGSGNITTLRFPLYIVNVKAVFEGGMNN